MTAAGFGRHPARAPGDRLGPLTAGVRRRWRGHRIVLGPLTGQMIAETHQPVRPGELRAFAALR